MLTGCMDTEFRVSKPVGSQGAVFVTDESEIAAGSISISKRYKHTVTFGLAYYINSSTSNICFNDVCAISKCQS